MESMSLENDAFVQEGREQTLLRLRILDNSRQMRVFYAIPNLPLLGFRQCCDKFLEFPQVLLCLKRPELPQMNQTTAASSVSERRLDHED